MADVSEPLEEIRRNLLQFAIELKRDLQKHDLDEVALAQAIKKIRKLRLDAAPEYVFRRFLTYYRDALIESVGSKADISDILLPRHDETMAALGSLTIRPQPAPHHALKSGNLFNPVPDNVPYNGCSDKDCLPGCNIGKGHCQRLENAFRMAGYADATE